MDKYTVQTSARRKAEETFANCVIRATSVTASRAENTTPSLLEFVLDTCLAQPTKEASHGCMHARMHTHARTHMHAHAYAHVCACTQACSHTHVHVPDEGDGCAVRCCSERHRQRAQEGCGRPQGSQQGCKTLHSPQRSIVGPCRGLPAANCRRQLQWPSDSIAPAVVISAAVAQRLNGRCRRGVDSNPRSVGHGM